MGRVKLGEAGTETQHVSEKRGEEDGARGGQKAAKPGGEKESIGGEHGVEAPPWGFDFTPLLLSQLFFSKPDVWTPTSFLS